MTTDFVNADYAVPFDNASSEKPERTADQGVSVFFWSWVAMCSVVLSVFYSVVTLAQVVKSYIKSITLPALAVIMMLPAQSDAGQDAIVLLKNDQGQCSGVCVDQSGIILTAKHCKHGETVSVEFQDGRRETAVRLYKGPGLFDGVTVYDIPGEGWPTCRVSTQAPRAGEDVWLCGYPAGQWRCKKGSMIGESKHLTGERFHTVTIPTQPGWSGGPLLNSRGEVIGLLSHTDVVISGLSSRPDPNGRSYAVDHSRVIQAYTLICNGIRSKPGTLEELDQIAESVPDGLDQPADLSEFDGVLIVLSMPEFLTDGKGLFADIAGPAAYGIPKRMVSQVSDGRAQFLAISERFDPEKFTAFNEALDMPPDRPAVVAFIPKTSQGLVKGLIIKKIENEIISKLGDVIFSPVFERVSAGDYQRGVEVAQRQYSAQPANEQSMLDRAKAAALDEITSKMPDKTEIASAVAAKLSPMLPEAISGKVETAASWWEVYQRGGLGLLVITVLGSRVHSHYQGKALRSILGSLTADKVKPSQPSA